MRKGKKQYRAFFIDGRVVIRVMAAVLSALLVAAIACVNWEIADKRLSFDGGSAALAALEDSVPAAVAASVGAESFFSDCVGRLYKGLCFVMTFDSSDLQTVLFSEIPLTRAVRDSALIAMAEEARNSPAETASSAAAPEPVPLAEDQRQIKGIDSSQTKALGESASKILLNNQTSYSIDINEMLTAPLALDMSREGPKILILHTHATEAYAPDGAQTYSVGQSDRSQDITQNVVRVGAEMAKVLRENGIETLHDTTLHDYPSYNGSYGNSLATAQQYIQRYPSIQAVLDVHRDAIVYDDGTKAKVVTEIDGQPVSQIMLVVGTDGSGLEHPFWRNNMRFAIQLQNYTVAKYPYLMRAVNLRQERFNGHTASGSVILEIGTSGNSLEESVRAGRLMAECIAGFLKENT